MRPNGYDCGECEFWDDINGCWRDVRDIYLCEIYRELTEGD